MSAIKEKLHDQIEAGMRKAKIIPILFKTPMVQAILSGNKSMTRRTNGLEEINKNPDEFSFAGRNRDFHHFRKGYTQYCITIKCPYGQSGDVLWVRESFLFIDEEEKFPAYKTQYTHPELFVWKPSIHMTFEACRIFLRVKEIRVERLHDISGKDAISEGIEHANHIGICVPEGVTIWTDYTNAQNYFQRATYSFKSLWVSIKGIYSWNANPWVWVVSFERITDAAEIAEIRKQWNERRAK